MGDGLGALVERDAELTAMRNLVAAATDGSGHVVLVEGPPGSGKTSLVDAVARAARDGGVRVLRARGLELEQLFPFGVVLQLYEGELADPAARERLLAGAAALAAPVFPAVTGSLDTSGEEPHALIHGLFWLTNNLASSPLLITVDDAHWADEVSIRALAYLAARLRDLPIGIVLAARSGTRTEPGGDLRALASSPGGQVVRPGPLTADGAAQVVRAYFPDADDALCAACARMSGGDPFLLTELLIALTSNGVAPITPGRVAQLVPESVANAVLARLAGLGQDAVTLARAVAVLGDRTPLRLAAELAELDPRSAGELADALTRAQILAAGEPLSFRHPILAAAVDSDVTPDAASRAHRRAAELLSEAGEPAEAVAAHLLRTTPAGDPWVVQTLRAAAGRARERDEGVAVQRFLARALEEPPGAEAQGPVLVELALAEAANSDPGAPARLAEALERIDDPQLRARTLQALSRMRVSQGDYGDATEIAARGMEELPPEDPLARELLADFIAAAGFHPKTTPVANERMAAALADLDAGAPLQTYAPLLGHLALALVLMGAPRDRSIPLARSALELAGGEGAASPSFFSSFTFAVAALHYSEEYDLAEQAIAAVLPGAERRGSMIDLAALLHWQASIAHQRGQIAEAIDAAERAYELRSLGWTAYAGWTGRVLAHAHMERGELERAAEVLDGAQAVDHGEFVRCFLLEARARHAALSGDHATALARYREAGAGLRGGFGFDHPSLLAWRAGAALAAHHVGDAAQARELAADALERARAAGGGRPLGLALRASGLIEGGEEGIALLREAAGVLEHSPTRLEYARALLALGAAIRRAGRPADARDPLRRSLAIASELGGTWTADAAREELVAAGGRPRRAARSGAGSLTPSELRVAKLAATGMTNAEVAQSLFVTTKTVEWHLRNAYGKLGIVSRDELAGALA